MCEPSLVDMPGSEGREKIRPVGGAARLPLPSVALFRDELLVQFVS